MNSFQDSALWTKRDAKLASWNYLFAVVRDKFSDFIVLRSEQNGERRKVREIQRTDSYGFNLSALRRLPQYFPGSFRR
jgi:hypothetical protein